MKSHTINLETLNNGAIRVTGRINGRTVEYFEGNTSQAKELVSKAMAVTCSAHRISGDKYDMTYIELNPAAAAAR